MKPFLSVIMKPTLSCNAHCRHCYHRPSECDGTVMDVSTAENVIRMVRAEYDSARYMWTGGEPLLAGERFFRKVYACQKEAYGKAIGRCGNTIQTNGLLLNPRFMEFCRDSRINVGVSFEAGYDRGLRPDIDRAKVESRLVAATARTTSTLHRGRASSRYRNLCTANTLFPEPAPP